jgi:hypothetical protein
LTFSVFVNNTGAVSKGPSDYWRLIARSSDIYIINSNDMKFHVTAMEGGIKNKYYYYQVPVVETLKGMAVNNVKFRVYLRQGFIDYIYSLPDNTKLVIFLNNIYAKSRNSDEDEFSNYFVNSTVPAWYHTSIIVYSPVVYNEINTEISKQRIVVQEKLYEAFQKDAIRDNMIKNLIDKLADKEWEMSAFDELIMAGRESIPYIILHMEDYRELPIKYARLIDDSPGTWEGIVQYSPDLVIDALTIVLSELTSGISFGTLRNGDCTNEERQRVLNGWRIYLYYHHVENEPNKNTEFNDSRPQRGRGRERYSSGSLEPGI